MLDPALSSGIVLSAAFLPGELSMSTAFLGVVEVELKDFRV